MKFVIPCSSRKRQSFWMYKGRRVKFVANPQMHRFESFLYCKPDDIIPGSTEHEARTTELQSTRHQPVWPASAADLCIHTKYTKACRRMGHMGKHCHSVLAGWGLVRAILLPSYYITFSKQANAYKRGNIDKYNTSKDLLEKWCHSGRYC